MIPDVLRVDPGDASLAYLRGRLALVESRVRRAVDRRRTDDPDPGDRFRGLYVSDEQVDALLGRNGNSHGTEALAPADHAGASGRPDGASEDARLEGWADAREAAGADLRLRRLARAFALDDRDVDLLLVAMAPDLDARFERLYGYLHDDVTRRRASVGLGLELVGLSPWASHARGRLAPMSTLCSSGLLCVEEPERPMLGRPLRIPDRVTAHVLGSDVPDPLVADLILAFGHDASLAEAGRLADALGRGIGLVYFRERVGSAVLAASAEAFARLGIPVLALDLTRLAEASDAGTAMTAAVREARLLGAGILAGPIDALAATSAGAIRALADAPGPVVLVGRVGWEPVWSSRVPWMADAPLASMSERTVLWEGGLGSDGLAGVAFRMASFRLSPQQIERAERSARIRARADGRTLELADLQAGARAENASGLERLARRVQPRATWRELVLPDGVRTQLRELTARARRRDVVIDEWGMGGGASHGRGITALFGGDPGTGKTMSAEVIAAELGLDLYVIDLSSVVDKYIGETEKNLDRIFSEADRINGVLLFDEADALFGQRSEVRDARDRYANVEIAYLLQRMEHFDGLAILTTNLRANIDEAFLRRLDAVIDFPLPEEDDRLAIWRLHLPDRVPRGDDLDLAFMAQRFRLSGGHIRNVCLTAAFLAAERGEALTMADLIRGTEREYGKLGRLTVADEFGPYLSVLRGP